MDIIGIDVVDAGVVLVEGDVEDISLENLVESHVCFELLRVRWSFIAWVRHSYPGFGSSPGGKKSR